MPRRALPLLASAAPAVALIGAAAAFALPGAEIHTVELRGVIHPLSADYLIEAIDEADRDGASALIIEIDTPGGLVESTKEITQRMLRAKTPIVVYVSPSGARAASAGFLLLIASDTAAMAPGTNTGAAHPVDISGPSSKDDIGLKKAESDLATFARTIAQNRRRNVDLAQKAVVESVSFTEAEALRKGLIDLIARDRTELLAKLNGRKIRRFDGSETVLNTTGPVREPLQRSLVQRLLGPLLQPELVVILLGIGILGLYVELTHPGLILPGVVGVLCLLLFALAFRYLPVNMVGLLLLTLGVALFVLEIKVVSHGFLTAGGIACLVAGMLMLFPRDIPALRLPVGFVLPIAHVLAAVMGLLVTLVTRAQTARIVTGAEGMIGEVGRAASDLEPFGKVFVHGETWEARSGSPVARGQEVRVTGVEGLRLLVERIGGGS